MISENEKWHRIIVEDENGNNHYAIIDQDNLYVCRLTRIATCSENSMSEKDTAALIASAPRLHKALQALAYLIELREGERGETLDEAFKALDEAEGR